MRRIALLTCISVVIFVIGVVVKLSSGDEGRVALVIGNADYKVERLANPINDANSISNTLRKLGFKVDTLTDANRRQMSEAINRFGDKLKKNAIGFFYFSGHGAQVNGENYLFPIDANINNERDIKYATVHVGEVLDAMADAKNSVNIVIIDACRNNPFARSWRSGAKGLAPIHAAKGMIIAYSTAPGGVASDGPPGGNSPYMKYLVRQMFVPGLPVEQVFKQVRKDVQGETGGKQMPWESSSLIGDFFFKPSGKLAAPPVEITPSPSPSPSPIFQQAQKAYIAGHFGEPEGNNAIELARQVLQGEPGHQGARNLLAKAAAAYERQAKASLEKNDRDAALKIYQRLAKLFPEKPEYLKEASALEKSAAISFIGNWHWSVASPFVPDRTNTINADGTCKLSDGSQGKWSLPGGDKNHIVFTWGFWVHDMILSPDGLSMAGKDNWGTRVTGRKLTGP
jgi:hypothetical protein